MHTFCTAQSTINIEEMIYKVDCGVKFYFSEAGLKAFHKACKEYMESQGSVVSKKNLKQVNETT